MSHPRRLPLLACATLGALAAVYACKTDSDDTASTAPSGSEVAACAPWLQAEVQLVKPKMIVCFGATAAQALLGNKFRLTTERGIPQPHPWAPYVVATIHPSAILRVPDPTQRHEEYGRLVADLKKIRSFVK